MQRNAIPWEFLSKLNGFATIYPFMLLLPQALVKEAERYSNAGSMHVQPVGSLPLRLVERLHGESSLPPHSFSLFVFLRLYHPTLTRSISFLPLALSSPKFPLSFLFRATSTFLDLPSTPRFLSPSGDCIVPVLLPCMDARAPSERCSPFHESVRFRAGRFLSQAARSIHPAPPSLPFWHLHLLNVMRCHVTLPCVRQILFNGP